MSADWRGQLDGTAGPDPATRAQRSGKSLVCLSIYWGAAVNASRGIALFNRFNLFNYFNYFKFGNT